MNVEVLNTRISSGFADADMKVDAEVRFTDMPYSTFTSSGLAGMVLKRAPLFEPIRANGIDRVIFNAPATIVIWLDGTKTVVKCQPGDEYDPQAGLALCFMKKALGNSSRRFNDTLHAYID